MKTSINKIACAFFVMLLSPCIKAERYTGVFSYPQNYTDERLARINQFFGDQIAYQNQEKQTQKLLAAFKGMKATDLFQKFQKKKENFNHYIWLYKEDDGSILLIFSFLFTAKTKIQITDKIMYHFKVRFNVVVDAWQDATICFFGPHDNSYDKNPEQMTTDKPVRSNNHPQAAH